MYISSISQHNNIIMYKSNTLFVVHCKNVRVISTLPGFAQLHLFRGIYVSPHIADPYGTSKIQRTLY